MIFVKIAAVIIGLYVLYLLNMTSRYFGIKRLKYSRSFSVTSVYEGQKVFLAETVYNNFFLPLLFLDIEAHIYGNLALKGYTAKEKGTMQHFLSRFFLLPYMQTKRTYEITCIKRGYYKLETVGVRFWGDVKYFKSETEIYVFPKPLPIGDMPLPANVLQGSYISNRWLFKDPFSLSGVREYRTGDPFNTINFKATAKTAQLRVNNTDFCSNRNIMVYLNFQNESETIDSKKYRNLMEKGLSFCADIVRGAIEHGLKIGFSANCRLIDGNSFLRFPISGGHYHLEAILKEMAKITTREGYSFNSVLEMDIESGIRSSEIFIITPYISENTSRKIDIFKRTENTVNIIPL